MSAKIFLVSSTELSSLAGISFIAGRPSFSTKNSSPLYIARLTNSKNMFLASVAEITFIVYEVYKIANCLSIAKTYLCDHPQPTLEAIFPHQTLILPKKLFTNEIKTHQEEINKR